MLTKLYDQSASKQSSTPLPVNEGELERLLQAKCGEVGSKPPAWTVLWLLLIILQVERLPCQSDDLPQSIPI